MNPRGHTILVVLTTWGTLCLASASAQEPQAKTGPTLRVSESATVGVKPNSARVRFAVPSTEATAKTARDENNKQVEKIKSGIIALKIENLDIQIRPSAITSILPQGVDFQGVPKAPKSQVQTGMIVTIREKNEEKLRELVSKVSDFVTENGGTAPEDKDRFGFSAIACRGQEEIIHGPKIDWLCEDYQSACQESIKKAIDDAHANAKAAAGDAKLKVLDISITPPDGFFPVSH